MGPQLVGVFAHPDDEAFAAGGTFALAARLGARVQLVCLTRGERGTARDAPELTGASLAERRSAELEASCRALGAEPPLFLDLPDGGVRADAPAAARLAAILDALAPDVVITLGPDGAYGHVDHLACTALVTHTVKPPIPIVHCAFERDLFRVVRDRVARVAPELIVRNDLGVDRPDVTVDIDVVRDTKLAAIAAHRSQLRAADPRSLFPSPVIDRLLDQERFVVART